MKVWEMQGTFPISKRDRAFPSESTEMQHTLHMDTELNKMIMHFLPLYLLHDIYSRLCTMDGLKSPKRNKQCVKQEVVGKGQTLSRFGFLL